MSMLYKTITNLPTSWNWIQIINNCSNTKKESFLMFKKINAFTEIIRIPVELLFKILEYVYIHLENKNNEEKKLWWFSYWIKTPLARKLLQPSYKPEIIKNSDFEIYYKTKKHHRRNNSFISLGYMNDMILMGINLSNIAKPLPKNFNLLFNNLDVGPYIFENKYSFKFINKKWYYHPCIDIIPLHKIFFFETTIDLGKYEHEFDIEMLFFHTNHQDTKNEGGIIPDEFLIGDIIISNGMVFSKTQQQLNVFKTSREFRFGLS